MFLIKCNKVRLYIQYGVKILGIKIYVKKAFKGVFILGEGDKTSCVPLNVFEAHLSGQHIQFMSN